MKLDLLTNPTVVDDAIRFVTVNTSNMKAVARATCGTDIKAMRVIPISFHTHHKEMLGHSKILLERGNIAINPKFDKSITALRTAIDHEGTLDKEATYNDIFYAFRLGLKCYGYPRGDASAEIEIVNMR